MGMRASTRAAAVGCMALLSYFHQAISHEQRLAILLPADGDGRHERPWAIHCSPGRVTQKVDLVLFVSQPDIFDRVMEVDRSDLLENHCFARVRTVQRREVNYDKLRRPSTDMLYSAFLDAKIRSQLTEYDALVVIPSWTDETAATDAAAADLSVDTLYDLAFFRHGPEEKFWVKTVKLPGGDSQKPGGGGAVPGGDVVIYNNADPELVDFVLVTHKLQRQQQKRWGAASLRRFGKALSYTLKEPEYEKLASMFVTADLTFENSGGDAGDQNAGGLESERRALSSTARSKGCKRKGDRGLRSMKFVEKKDWKEEKKGRGKRPKWRREKKYKDLQKWKNAIPSPAGTPCHQTKCARVNPSRKRGRVCDPRCKKQGRHGIFGCSARNGMYGQLCRVCFNDIEAARKYDHPDNRVIMCETMEPPTIYGYGKKEKERHHWGRHYGGPEDEDRHLSAAGDDSQYHADVGIAHELMRLKLQAGEMRE